MRVMNKETIEKGNTCPFARLRESACLYNAWSRCLPRIQPPVEGQSPGGVDDDEVV